MDIKEMKVVGDKLHLVQNKVQRRIPLNQIMNLRISYKSEFLDSLRKY
jgi:hypothetical protein